MASAWILYILFRYTKLSAWYKSTISIFLLGVLVSPVMNYFVDTYLGDEPFGLARILSFACCALITAALGVLGYMRSKKA